jgi:hypothetical protein
MGDDDDLMRAIEDIIRELEWEGPQRWAPVTQRLRRLVEERRSASAPGSKEGGAQPEPPSRGAGRARLGAGRD